MLEAWKRRARDVAADVRAMALALRDPRTPWYARVLAFVVVAYALSPVDLIPDVVPVLGHLDDLVLVPLGVAAVARMIPADVLADCRRQAREAKPASPVAAVVGAAIVVVLWLVVAVVVWRAAAG
jgi:uncharacterized membrane protein YkvA (DUF1232 family)